MKNNIVIQWSSKNFSRLSRIFSLFIAVSILLACQMPLKTMFLSSGQEETRVALGIQGTLLAGQQTKAAQELSNMATSSPPGDATSVELSPPDPANPQGELPTYTPYPTYTLPYIAPPTIEPVPSEENKQDIEEQIKNAKILVYEDGYGYNLDQRVNDAINGLGLAGGNYVNVRDAMGNFMSQLNSGTDWDLIVIGSESRNSIKGEFWDVIGPLLDEKTAMVAEIWYLDSIANGRIAPILNRCGISYQKDLIREPNANLNDYLVYILEPDSSLFSKPNTIGMLIPTSDYAWVDDVGDYVKLSSSGNATLLAGFQPSQHSSYGVIAECMEGRVIFQTFSTHDYKYADMINLWQNYIIYTLTNHFETMH